MGKWGSICDDEWDMREATVVCHQLGYEKPYRVTHSSMFGPARRRFWMDNLYCTGEEKNLSSCRFDGWGSNDCTSSEAAGVVCMSPEMTATEEPSTTPAPVIKKPLTRIHDATEHKMSMRLVGGRVKEEGRVEIKFGNSEWGLICGDGWSIFEAMVVCRELGFGYANDAIQTDFFGGNSSAIMLSGVNCTGNEESLEHCLHSDMGEVSCPGKRENIAAVSINPEFKVAEMSYDNNAAVCTLYYTESFAHIFNCTIQRP
ncbi:hypothetical protein C0J52_20193 [Blattella germanica]|nr:hypothetical protein C0J52_20193 [Blattella germanica]